jgi:hypothetical protein
VPGTVGNDHGQPDGRIQTSDRDNMPVDDPLVIGIDPDDIGR